MNTTRAVPLELLRMAAGAGDFPLPMCPGCIGGRLYPYHVSITVGLAQSYYGADYLTGWVAVCQGNTDYNRVTKSDTPNTGPCGFSMTLTPHQFPGRNNR